MKATVFSLTFIFLIVFQLAHNNVALENFPVRKKKQIHFPDHWLVDLF